MENIELFYLFLLEFLGRPIRTSIRKSKKTHVKFKILGSMWSLRLAARFFPSETKAVMPQIAPSLSGTSRSVSEKCRKIRKFSSFSTCQK